MNGRLPLPAVCVALVVMGCPPSADVSEPASPAGFELRDLSAELVHSVREPSLFGIGDQLRRGALVSPWTPRELALRLPGDTPALRFAYGPSTGGGGPWGCEGGARFELGLTPDGGRGARVAVFDDSVPDEGPQARWRTAAVDLVAWAGQDVVLDLQLSPVDGAVVADDGCAGVVADLRLASGAEASVAPDIALIVVDTLRADHVGYAGNPAVRTPRIDGLAERSLRYERAYSGAAWTVEAMNAMFTGDHAYLDVPFNGARTAVGDLEHLDDSIVELLADAGYRTMALYNNPSIGVGSGVERGFQVFEARHDPVMADGIAPLYDELDPRQPGFLLLHLMSPHAPYEFHDGHTPAQLEAIGQGGLSAPPADLSPKRGQRWSEAERARCRAYYRGEVEASDAWVGAILDALAVRERERPLWVFFTSDHGEEFWEHGTIGHGHSMYDEVMRVPLLVRPPSGVADAPAPQARPELVSTIDLAHTWAALAGLQPLSSRSGLDLLTLLEDPAAAGTRTVAGTSYFLPGGTVSALIDSQRKTHWFSPPQEPPPARGDGTSFTDLGLPVAVFDLEADPQERAPLAVGSAAAARRVVERRALFDALALRGAAVLQLEADAPAGEPLVLEIDGASHAAVLRQPDEPVACRVPSSPVREPGSPLRVELEAGQPVRCRVQLSGLRESSPWIELAEAAGGATARVPTPWSSLELLDEPLPTELPVAVRWVAGGAALAFGAPAQSIDDRLEALGYLDP